MDNNKRNQQVKWLTLAAVLGLAHWFFGNLYEAIVISPNWVVDSPAQLTRLNEFFVRTSPTLFFMPLTPIAAVLVWVVSVLNRERALAPSFARASIFMVLAMAVNVVIVSALIFRLFGDDYQAHAAELHSYATRWNILNVFRMAFVGTTIVYLFEAFRQLDRAQMATTRPAHMTHHS